jgi:hypothetical protein
VFGIFFFFGKNQACQTRPYGWDGLSPATWARLNGLRPKPRILGNKINENQTRGFCWKFMKNIGNTLKNLAT